MSKYNKIKDLIELWEEFETKEKKNDFLSFSVWLHNRNYKEKLKLEVNTAEGEHFLSEPVNKKYLEFYKDIHINGQIGSLINRLGKYQHFHTKKIFKDLAISSMHEFGFLAAIENMGNPRKSEVISIQIIELTTGTEIIKRLVRESFVKEVEDEEDKRSKRLTITKKGKNIVKIVKERLLEIGILFLGNMGEKEKKNFLSQLIYLNNFHNNLYFNQQNLALKELIEKNVLGK